MNVQIVKPVDIKLNGTMQALAAWTRLNLPADKAKKLIDAGYAEPCNMAEESRALVLYFGGRDPGGECWPWVEKNQADLWRSHIKAMLADDLTTARSTFDALLSAWEGRHDHQQPDLLAA